MMKWVHSASLIRYELKVGHFSFLWHENTLMFCMDTYYKMVRVWRLYLESVYRGMNNAR